jgi:hypothetical protein
MEKKKMLMMEVHPKNVLIKITQSEWNDLFSIWITQKDGNKVQLFSDVEEPEDYERRFRQNVSVGNIISVGSKVKGLLKGDIAVIDYLVTANHDSMVGIQFGNRIVSIKADTTYHTFDSPPQIDGRKTYKEGDYEEISPLLGFVRMGKLYARSPYVFLKFEDPTKIAINKSGMMIEKEDTICTREVIAASPDTDYKEGDRVLIKESDLFSRFIENDKGRKEISVIFQNDILGLL